MTKATRSAGKIRGGRVWHWLVDRGRKTACTGQAPSERAHDFLGVSPQCFRCIAALKRAQSPRKRTPRRARLDDEGYRALVCRLLIRAMPSCGIDAMWAAPLVRKMQQDSEWSMLTGRPAPSKAGGPA